MEAAKRLVNNTLGVTGRREKSEAARKTEEAGRAAVMHIHTEQVLGLIPPGQMLWPLITMN